MIFSALSQYYKARVKLTKFRRMLSIPKGKRVIDIGGGDGPFPRADVICEKFLGDNAERTNPLGFAGSRALVVGDIERLPFADKSFDFVFCSHILEHTSDPTVAINEITRIGKAGYIEVPSEYLETTATSRTSHYWTIVKEKDGTLVFRQKSRAVPNPVAEDLFNNVLWEKDQLYTAWHWKSYYSHFNIGVNWVGTIPHRVEKAKSIEQDGFFKGSVDSLDSVRRALESSATHKPSGLRPTLKRFVTDSLTNRNVRSELLTFLACPTCRGGLTTSGPEKLVCGTCKVSFPYIQGVPVLLTEHARPVS